MVQRFETPAPGDPRTVDHSSPPTRLVGTGCVRVLLGVALLWLGWGGVVDGTLGPVLKIVGFVPLLTGIVGWCPLYAPLRFSTKR